MTDQFQSQVAQLRAVVQSVDERLASGNIPREDIDGLKTAVDDMRLRIWASMHAAEAGDPGVLVRFRLRRTAEMCRTIAADLAAGRLVADAPELQELARHARTVIAALPAGT